MKELFLISPSLVIFLHILSAIVWIGGMIAIRFAVHFSMQKIDEPKIKLGRTLENLQRFFQMVIPSIIILLLTALLLIYGLQLNNGSLSSIVHIKESIWVIMTTVFIIVYVKRNKAQHAFDQGNFPHAKAQLEPIAKYYIPLNIILGLLALYLGVTLRGF